MTDHNVTSWGNTSETKSTGDASKPALSSNNDARQGKTQFNKAYFSMFLFYHLVECSNNGLLAFILNELLGVGMAPMEIYAIAFIKAPLLPWYP